MSYLTITGDLYLGEKPIKFDNEIVSVLNKSQYTCSNFEGAITENFSPRTDKSSILTINIDQVEHYVKSIKTNHLFSLGNNHIHDLGFDGVSHTKHALLNMERVLAFGAGLSEEVSKPLIINVEDKVVALMAMSTDIPEVMGIVATNEEPGVLDFDDPKVLDIIRDTKDKVDFLVLLPHWGREYIKYPSYHIRKKSYAWIDAGADLIVGHHPHIIQGKEKYKDKWIYYSLGNYIFPNFYTKRGYLFCWPKENCYSFFLQLSFTDKIQINEYGTFFNTTENKLFPSLKSLDFLNHYSLGLDYCRVSKKNYNGLWQYELYVRLRKEYSWWLKMKKAIFTKHRDLSVIKRVFRKLSRK